MTNYCNHIECQKNFPSQNWGHQRCLYVDGRLNKKGLFENRIEELEKLVKEWQGNYDREWERRKELESKLRNTEQTNIELESLVETLPARWQRKINYAG